MVQPCLIFSFLTILGPGLAVQSERSESISQPHFGAAAGRVIATVYPVLTKELYDIQPAINECKSRVQDQVNNCESCIETLSCKRSPGVLDYIQAVTKIHLAPSISIIETGLQSAADELTKAAEDIYEKYGEGALNALETKFQGIKDVRNTLKKAAENAINQAKKKGKKLKKKLKKKFGKRRRRYLLIPKREIPELTKEQRRCLEKCPDCIDLLSGDNLQIMSARNWNSAGGRMTKCKIDVHLYPDNSRRNTGWEYKLLRKLEKHLCWRLWESQN